jgi:uncharacterized oxidoreductase
MPTIDAKVLTPFIQNIFEAHNVPSPVAQVVATSLVLSNLKGHDSHGIIRMMTYVDWLSRGWINPKAELEVLLEDGSILMMDGHYGFGQYIGRQATYKAIEKTVDRGACILTLRRSGHLGRLGEFAELAAEAGLVHFSFTNTHGGGVIVAPFGGRERRLGANPVAAGAPIEGREAIIMDFATSTTAEGKLKIARARGEQVSPGLFLNSEGQPSTQPEEFYGDPPGALMTMAQHKGFALSVFAEILAGALTGGSCSRPDEPQVANGWFALFLDPKKFSGQKFFGEECSRFGAWVKSSQVQDGFSEVLLPGEPECRMFELRSSNGIPVEDDTWHKIGTIASDAGVPIP